MIALAAVLLLLMAGAGLLIGRRFLVVTVEGISMTPSLRPGDRLLARRTGRGTTIERDAVVVLRHDDGSGYYIKRVTSVAGDPVPDGIPAATPSVPPGTVVLRGDNVHASLDSRLWGCVPVGQIIAVTLRQLA